MLDELLFERLFPGIFSVPAGNTYDPGMWRLFVLYYIEDGRVNCLDKAVRSTPFGSAGLVLFAMPFQLELADVRRREPEILRDEVPE